MFGLLTFFVLWCHPLFLVSLHLTEFCHSQEITIIYCSLSVVYLLYYPGFFGLSLFSFCVINYSSDLKLF